MERQLNPIAVTGIGIFSSIGRNVAETVASLRSGKSGIGEITLFDTAHLRVRHSAEIIGYNPLDYFGAEEAEELDRTTQFAHIAVEQAVADAAIDLKAIPSDRIAIVAGVCSGTFELLGSTAEKDEAAWVRQRLERVRHFQTATIAKKLGIHGPQASVSTACASSSTALAYAYELLQSGRADVALVGGADGLLYVTYAGFYALGAMPERPCSPFSTNTGVSFGEGAGYVVLEPLHKAQARGAKVYGELAGYGCTSDAYHFTSPHPSGEGLRRAMDAALRRAGAVVEDIGYVNAHGTGTRDNDTAESLALTGLCEGKQPPPMSSTKSFTGHTLGAAGILEFIISLLGSREGFLPPTVNFEAPRPGCELDYVPNQARPADYNLFLSNSAAFGGVNASVAGRRDPLLRARQQSVPRIVITGIGVVSPAGCGLASFRQALQNGSSTAKAITRFNVSDCRNKSAALISEFKPRQLTPTLDVRRLDLLNQYAAVSAGLAYSDACLTRHPVIAERIGAVVALAAGPISTQEAFNQNLREKGVEGVSAKYFPSIVISTVGGQVCQSLQLKGLNSTVCDGMGAGLHGVIHAYEMLRGSVSEDQIIVIAPDEVARWLFRNLDAGGLLDDESRPYDSSSAGFLMGEGSFALVLERSESAEARGARIYAEILGYGAKCDTASVFAQSIDDKWMRECMNASLHDAATGADEISFAVGLGNGRAAYDAAERTAFTHVLGESVPISLPVSLLGMGLASCGTAAVSVGALGLQDNRVYLPSTSVVQAPRPFRKSLIFGGSETGNYASIVLGLPQ